MRVRNNLIDLQKTIMTDKIQWHLFTSAEEVAHYAVQLILIKAQESISQRGIFKMVLAGGTTPKRIYELLAEHEQEWSKWHLFIGDERCLAVDNVERNSLMVQQVWLDKVKFPMANFFPIAAEKGPEQAAIEYADKIRASMPFDMTLLGIGEDGHTASLFPGHLHNENELTHAVFNSPKPPSERVSLSNRALSDSAKVMILVTGAGKKTAVQHWQHGEPLPVSKIRSLQGVDVLIDKEALP